MPGDVREQKFSVNYFNVMYPIHVYIYSEITFLYESHIYNV